MSAAEAQEITDRYRFEQAYRDTFPVSCLRIGKFDRNTWDGQYEDAYVMVAWELWKARGKLDV